MNAEKCGFSGIEHEIGRFNEEDYELDTRWDWIREATTYLKILLEMKFMLKI